MRTTSIQKSMRTLSILFLAVLIMSNLEAQLISVKTIPVATGDQFLLFPSQNLGMGGLSVSLSDSLSDPWVNPAKGSRMRGLQVYSSPVSYHIANGLGSARTMPFSLRWGNSNWFGGAGIALQSHDSDENTSIWQPNTRLLSANSSENRYFTGFVGKPISKLNSSIAASIYWADLSALGGVDLLYANSQSIKQEGSISDLRIGYTHDSPSGASQEILVLRNEVDMLHEVSYWDWAWSSVGSRIEKNLDHTITYGLHTGFTVPLNDMGWQYGGLFTRNSKSHPKIPNYEIMNIPRDPGNTLAYNFGLGLSQQDSTTMFGIDVIYEPIWSNTWAEADTNMMSREDQVIHPGDKTIENDFEFSNWILRTGLGWRDGHKFFQLGLQMRTISYTLDQSDYIAVTERTQTEYWSEWTSTWGISFEYPAYTIRYSGRTTMGTGQPGIESSQIWFTGTMEAGSNSDFLLAPSDDLTLEEARVITHQVSISMPIG